MGSDARRSLLSEAGVAQAACLSCTCVGVRGDSRVWGPGVLRVGGAPVCSSARCLAPVTPLKSGEGPGHVTVWPFVLSS